MASVSGLRCPKTSRLMRGVSRFTWSLVPAGEGRVPGRYKAVWWNVFVDFLRSVASYDVGRGASRICLNRIFIASISHIQTRLHAIGSNTELGVCASPAIAFLTDDRGAGMIAPRS